MTYFKKTMAVFFGFAQAMTCMAKAAEEPRLFKFATGPTYVEMPHEFIAGLPDNGGDIGVKVADDTFKTAFGSVKAFLITDINKTGPVSFYPGIKEGAKIVVMDQKFFKSTADFYKFVASKEPSGKLFWQIGYVPDDAPANTTIVQFANVFIGNGGVYKALSDMVVEELKGSLQKGGTPITSARIWVNRDNPPLEQNDIVYSINDKYFASVDDMQKYLLSGGYKSIAINFLRPGTNSSDPFRYMHVEYKWQPSPELRAAALAFGYAGFATVLGGLLTLDALGDHRSEPSTLADQMLRRDPQYYWQKRHEYLPQAPAP
jgi:hypothetical protein